MSWNDKGRYSGKYNAQKLPVPQLSLKEKRADADCRSNQSANYHRPETHFLSGYEGADSNEEAYHWILHHLIYASKTEQESAYTNCTGS